MKSKKRNGTLATIFIMVLYLCIGAVAGFLAGEYLDELFGKDAPVWVQMISVILMLMIAFIMFFIHIIIHEGGHLVFGLISGYRFSSFRIGNIIFSKQDGKMDVKKFSIPGTGGQCIMIPTWENYKDTPFVLYNLGGVLANLIVSVLVAGILTAFEINGICKAVLIMFVLVGVVSALINGVPLRTNTVDNDGMNIVTLKRNPEALREYVNMFYVHEEISKGKRLKEMDEKYFMVPEEGVREDTITTTVYLHRFLREVDKNEFEQAKEMADYILNNIQEMAGVHKLNVLLERLYCEIITDQDERIIESLYSRKEVQQYLKAAKNTISVARLQYAYALLVKKDEAAAEKYREQFYKIKKTYPYKSDAEAEEELLQFATSKNSQERVC